MKTAKSISTTDTTSKAKYANETALTAVILGYFKYSEIVHLFRCNSGLARQIFGNGFIHLAPKGTPDIIGFDKRTGAFIGIETKNAKGKKGKLRPEQAAFAKMLRGTENGIYILARSLDDVLDVIEPRPPLPF